MKPKKTNAIVQPYLFFNGRCEEAIKFYCKALGAKVEMLMRFKDSPEPPQPGCPAATGDKVMHANLRIGKSNVMMSDGRGEGPLKFEGFALSVSVGSTAEANRLFKGVAKGGQVVMPMAKTFYSPRFGMATDRFGVMWMIIVQSK